MEARIAELEAPVEDLQREANLGWNTAGMGLLLALLADVVAPRGRKKQADKKHEAERQFQDWLARISVERREAVLRDVLQISPAPEGSGLDFALGFQEHQELLRSMVEGKALRHAVRADDGRELLAAADMEPNHVFLEFIRGFQASNQAMVARCATHLEA